MLAVVDTQNHEVMYVHFVEFEVKPGEDTTFIESQKFEEKIGEKPFGLNHFHIYKDLNKEHRYFLIEYWNKKTDRENLEKSEEYQEYRKIRKIFIDKKVAQHECEKVV